MTLPKPNTMKQFFIGVLIFTIISLVVFFGFNSLKIDCEENPPMVSGCIKYNFEELEGCIREGYTGKGFMGLTDFNTEYWVCSEYGRIARRCVEWSEASPSNLTRDWENCK